jgi:hypothetical protein
LVLIKVTILPTLAAVLAAQLSNPIEYANWAAVISLQLRCDFFVYSHLYNLPDISGV